MRSRFWEKKFKKCHLLPYSYKIFGLFKAFSSSAKWEESKTAIKSCKSRLLHCFWENWHFWKSKNAHLATVNGTTCIIQYNCMVTSIFLSSICDQKRHLILLIKTYTNIIDCESCKKTYIGISSPRGIFRVVNLQQMEPRDLSWEKLFQITSLSWWREKSLGPGYWRCWLSRVARLR